MNERARYRITGSLFLVALAVIFVPMLFDGEPAPLQTPPAVPPAQTVSQAVPDFADLVPTSDVVERVEALRAEVDSEGFDTATGTRFGEPILATPSEAGETEQAERVWAVQAASFASQENARSFRQQLRTAGYEAFISTVKSGGEQRHRVAVGPLLSAVDADAIKNNIAQEFDVEPTVMEMTP